MIKSYAKLKKQNKEKFKIPKSAQDTVPIDTIYKDGIFVWEIDILRVIAF